MKMHIERMIPEKDQDEFLKDVKEGSRAHRLKSYYGSWHYSYGIR
jgi:hypothetical protein